MWKSHRNYFTREANYPFRDWPPCLFSVRSRHTTNRGGVRFGCKNSTRTRSRVFDSFKNVVLCSRTGSRIHSKVVFDLNSCRDASTVFAHAHGMKKYIVIKHPRTQPWCCQKQNIAQLLQTTNLQTKTSNNTVVLFLLKIIKVETEYLD